MKVLYFFGRLDGQDKKVKEGLLAALSRQNRRLASGSGPGRPNHDLIGVDPNRDLPLAGPVLGIDGVVLHGGVEPEAVAVGLAVIESRLKVFAASTAPATAATTTPFRPIATSLAAAALLLLAVLVLARTPRSSSSSGSSAAAASISPRSRRADPFAAGGILLVGGEAVLFAELAQLRGADFKLVGDPGVRAALADPGADLV